MKKYVKILGERNSGTNYITELVQKNFDVTVLNGSAPRLLNKIIQQERTRDLYFEITEISNFGWKHSMAPSRELLMLSRKTNQTAFISVAKNPYAWLLSMYKRPYHLKSNVSTFDSFITTPWPTVKRERHLAPFDNPITMWNEKNKSYIELCTYANATIISYESVLQDHNKFLEIVGKELNLNKKKDVTVNINNATKKGDNKDFDFYKQYYLNEEWLLKLSKQQIETITERLDLEVLTAFNYKTANYNDKQSI